MMNEAPIAPAADAPHGRFLRIKDIVADSRLSQATINRLHRAGKFPAKVQLSVGCIGWWESEYLAWKAGRDRAPAPG